MRTDIDPAEVSESLLQLLRQEAADNMAAAVESVYVT